MAVITPVRSDYANTSRESWLYANRTHPRRANRAAALILADIVGFLLAAYGAVLLAQAAGTSFAPLTDATFTSHLRAVATTDLVSLGAVVMVLARYSHYSCRIPFWSELRDVLVASGIALLCSGFVQFSLQLNDSRLLIGLTWMLFPATTMLSRCLARQILLGAGLWQLRAVVVGSDDAARQAERALLSESGLGYSIAGVIAPAELQGWAEGGRWRRVLQHLRAELLVLALDPRDPDVREMTESLVRDRVPFAVMPRLDGLPVLGFDRTSFLSNDTVMFLYRNNLAQPVARFTKIVFDVSAAVCLLILLAPLLLLIAALVKLDGGPILFAHRRVGSGGREFPCFKFRSMVVDGDATLRRALESDAATADEWIATQKLKHDPRVTWVGRTLRSTSLDEIPQLFNVLRLEMSLVGPRPIVRAEVPRYGSDIAYYYETRPGVTGLWQVSGRSDIGYAQRVQLDTWYVKNWTIWHDLAILAKTVPAVLQRRGAV